MPLRNNNSNIRCWQWCCLLWRFHLSFFFFFRLVFSDSPTLWILTLSSYFLYCVFCVNWLHNLWFFKHTLKWYSYLTMIVCLRKDYWMCLWRKSQGLKSVECNNCQWLISYNSPYHQMNVKKFKILLKMCYIFRKYYLMMAITITITIRITIIW